MPEEVRLSVPDALPEVVAVTLSEGVALPVTDAVAEPVHEAVEDCVLVGLAVAVDEGVFDTGGATIRMRSGKLEGRSDMSSVGTPRSIPAEMSKTLPTVALIGAPPSPLNNSRVKLHWPTTGAMRSVTLSITRMQQPVLSETYTSPVSG